MSDRHFTTAVLLACTCVAGVAAREPLATTSIAEDEIKLSGCLVRGEGDGAGYLLTNTTNDPAWQRSADANVAPSAVGTTGGFATIFYWLDDDDDLKKHVGHRVAIEGDLKSDLKDGEIELDRKAKWTELTVKSDGRTLKANVPHASVVTAPGSNGDAKNDVLVRRVDVEQVRMLDARCEP
jgi:hypothetical protein